MQPPLIGHPQRLEPFKNFLGVLAKGYQPILLTGSSGSGKKRIIQFLVENGPLNQEPIFSIQGLCFNEQLWAEGCQALNNKGTLIIDGIQHLPLPLQARFKDWLGGQRQLFSESRGHPSEWRIVATSVNPDEIWADLVIEFPYHIKLPALETVKEDIPYHIKYFLRDQSVRYLRYFFLLKTFFHQWPGNLRELENYLVQTMAYYNSLALPGDLKGEKQVFGEKKVRYYENVLKGEWWYYPYRFTSEFIEGLGKVLTQTEFRTKILRDQLVVSLLKDEPGFLVLDLTDPDFEKKANQIYDTFLYYLKA